VYISFVLKPGATLHLQEARNGYYYHYHCYYYSTPGLPPNNYTMTLQRMCNKSGIRTAPSELEFSSWQAHDLPGGSVDVDLVEAGPCGKARHRAHGADERVDEPSSDAGPHISYWQNKAGRGALHGWDVWEWVLGLRHADGEVGEPLLGVHLNLLLSLLGGQEKSAEWSHVQFFVHCAYNLSTRRRKYWGKFCTRVLVLFQIMLSWNVTQPLRWSLTWFKS